MLRLRLSGKLAEHAAPIANLRGPDLSVNNHIAVIDLAHKIPENIISRVSLPFSAPSSWCVDDHGVTVVLSAGIRSSSILATNLAATRRSSGRPAPLFYKYEIGRKLYAIYAPPEADTLSADYQAFITALGARTTLTDAQRVLLADVANSIENGMKISIRRRGPADIGWQIGDILPAITDLSSPYYGKVFNANLYTSHNNRDGNTLILMYNAFHLGTGRPRPGKNEVINAHPVWPADSSQASGEEISVRLRVASRVSDILD